MRKRSDAQEIRHVKLHTRVRKATVPRLMAIVPDGGRRIGLCDALQEKSSTILGHVAADLRRPRPGWSPPAAGRRADSSESCKRSQRCGFSRISCASSSAALADFVCKMRRALIGFSRVKPRPRICAASRSSRVKIGLKYRVEAGRIIRDQTDALSLDRVPGSARKNCPVIFKSCLMPRRTRTSSSTSARRAHRERSLDPRAPEQNPAATRPAGR